MAAVWMRVRTELRASWRASVALALLVALVVATVIVSLAGARRTDSSYRRLLDASVAYNLEVSVTGDVDPSILDEVAQLPQVERHGRIAILPSDFVEDPAAPPKRFEWNQAIGTVVDPDLGREWEIANVVSGRHPDITNPNETAVSETFLRERGLKVGESFSFRSLTFPEMFRVFGGAPVVPSEPAHTVKIVGVWRLPHDVSFVTLPGGLAYLSPAFYRERTQGLATLDVMYVRLHGGAASEGSFIRDATAMARDAGDDEGLSFLSQASLVHDVQRALDVQALALWLFGGLVAFAGLLVVGQSIARTLAQSAGDHPVLAAMGTSRTQLGGVAALQALAIAGGGALVGGVAGVLASPVMPLGIARPLEPDPGISLDWPIVASVVTATVLLLIARALPTIRASARGRSAELHPRVSQSAAVAARAGFPPTAVVGVRLALEPGGRGASIPMRVALAGTVIGIAAVAAAFTFGSSFDALLDTPAAYGWNWDIMVDGGDDSSVLSQKRKRLAATEQVAAMARVNVRNLTREDENFDAVGFEQIKGRVDPTVLDGRTPAAADEVALGTTTMERERLAIGDAIELPGDAAECGGTEGCAIAFTVVGRVVLPSVDDNPLDEGGAFTAEGLDRLEGSTGFSQFAIRLPPGSDIDAAGAAFGQNRVDWLGPERPIELENLSRVRAMPYVLAGVLAVLAIATLVHALVTSVRRRRHDLAVLKTIGFDRGQVARTVAWQVTTLVAIALIVALPLGIAGGRWGWRLMNGALGVGVSPLVPVVAIAAGVAAVLALANAIALVPARAAARTRPAVVLREE